MYPMDRKRQAELDYLARETASQQELQRGHRERFDRLAEQFAHYSHQEAEWEQRELSSLTSGEKEEHRALESAVDKALSAKSLADSADLSLRAAARKSRRRAWKGAAILAPFFTLIVLASTIGPGAHLIEWLILLGGMAIFIFSLMRSYAAKQAVADDAAKLHREASRLRGEAAKIVALGRFPMTSKLSRRAAELGLSSKWDGSRI